MADKKMYLCGNVKLPWIAFGTGVIWKYSRNPLLFTKTYLREALSSVKHRKWNRELYGNLYIKQILQDAYDSGFRFFDSGRIYGYAERAVASLSDKRDIALTTKCSMMDLKRKVSPSTVEGNLSISLRNLNRQTVDVYMLHWPEGPDWLKAYAQIIDEYKKGRCRVYGACNMEIEHLMDIERVGLPLPMIIQNELHPFNTRIEVREYCNTNGIQLMAHTPTARMMGAIRENDALMNIARNHNKPIASIIIRWHYQNGIIPVVSCFRKEHMESNLSVFDFSLSDGEMQQIESLNKRLYLLATRGVDDANYVYNL